MSDVSNIPRQYRRFVEAIKKGAVVLFPTDTVVGLGCRFDSEEGISRIRQIKGATEKTPLAVLISDEEQLDFLQVRRSPLANLLIEKFWPGGLTIVYTAEKSYPCSGKENSIGVRLPDGELLRQIIRAVGVPVAATSANFHGKPPPKNLSDVERKLKNMTDETVEISMRTLGQPSTVVRIEGGVLKTLREGAITKGEIEEVIGERS